MSGHDIIELVRVIAVIALVVAAAALATPQGRVPLALRGVLKVLRRDGRAAPVAPTVRPVTPARRLAAFALVLAAAFVALL
ncbi:MAG: hypothetical protein ACI4RD_09065 [Kiritimatiellia bacterium]